MFCPQCGQQQVANNTRFCPRCGLAISGLAEWVAGGGVIDARAEAAPVALVSPKRQGIRRGAKLMFFSAVLLPIFFGLCILVDNPLPLLFPISVFFSGLSLLLYSRFFVEEVAPAPSRQALSPRLGATLGNPSLPPASSIPASGFGGQQVRTSELAQPPSVTENTTKLLDRD